MVAALEVKQSAQPDAAVEQLRAPQSDFDGASFLPVAVAELTRSAANQP